MRFSEDDRVRVAGVRVEQEGETTEIAQCWIALNPSRNQVKIWLGQDQSVPAITASLAEAIIDWDEPPLPEMP